MKRMSMHAFEIYVRTGQLIADDPEQPEVKFNPWHDPNDGQFTFAGQGRYFGSGARGTGENGIRRAARASPANRSQAAAHSSVGSPAGTTKTRAAGPMRPSKLKRMSVRPSRARSASASSSSSSSGPMTAASPAIQSTLTRKPDLGQAQRHEVQTRRTSPGSTASKLKIAATKLKSGESRLVTVGGLKIVQFGPGVELVPVAVAPLEEFSAATAQGSALFKLDAVITGPQFRYMPGSANLQGQVIVNGRIFGNSAKDFYYMATLEGADGALHLTFGKGDPPRDVATAVGGAVPLLINGQEVSGYNKAWRRYLENAETGKNIVAYNSRTNTAALFIQPEGVSGYPLKNLRAFIQGAGYDYAVLFDGSGSTSLRYLGKSVVKASLIREPLIPLGIGFKARRR
jgi:hypothetical protein